MKILKILLWGIFATIAFLAVAALIVLLTLMFFDSIEAMSGDLGLELSWGQAIVVSGLLAIVAISSAVGLTAYFERRLAHGKK